MHVTPLRSQRGCLSYIVADAASNEAALIDPSEEITAAAYLALLAERGLSLAYIIETHTHADHISCAHALKQATGAQIIRHRNAPSREKDRAVGGGEEFPLGGSALRVLATPGHTDDSISISVGNAVFTGDALLIGGTGRTDFQQGDSAALYASLHETLGALPDDTIVYPAHDYKNCGASTIGAEKRDNPRFALDRETFIRTLDAHHPPKPELFERAISENSR